ncbi:MAG: hypothetical protein ACI4MR_03085 [Candidatus Aphodomorpha sp.]
MQHAATRIAAIAIMQIVRMGFLFMVSPCKSPRRFVQEMQPPFQKRPIFMASHLLWIAVSNTVYLHCINLCAWNQYMLLYARNLHLQRDQQIMEGFVMRA